MNVNGEAHPGRGPKRLRGRAKTPIISACLRSEPTWALRESTRSAFVTTAGVLLSITLDSEVSSNV